VNAKEVVVLGSVKGNVHAVDRVEIRKSGSVIGDLVTARLTIEEGARFKGSIDITTPSESGEKKPDSPFLGENSKKSEITKFQ
jgi:cytoskeletal protein CcmA (bactofilin family)